MHSSLRTIEEHASIARTVLSLMRSSVGPVALSKAVALPSTESSASSLPFFSVCRGGSEMYALLASSSSHPAILALARLAESVRSTNDDEVGGTNMTESTARMFDYDGVTSSIIITCCLIDIISSTSSIPRLPSLIASSTSSLFIDNEHFGSKSYDMSGLLSGRHPRRIVQGYQWVAAACDYWIKQNLTVCISDAAALLHKRRVSASCAKSNDTCDDCHSCNSAILHSIAMTGALVWGSVIGGRDVALAVANAAVAVAKGRFFDNLVMVQSIGHTNEIIALPDVIVLQPTTSPVSIPEHVDTFMSFLFVGDLSISVSTCGDDANALLPVFADLPPNSIIFVSGFVSSEVIAIIRNAQSKQYVDSSLSTIIGGVGSSGIKALAALSGGEVVVLAGLNNDDTKINRTMHIGGRVGNISVKRVDGRWTLLVSKYYLNSSISKVCSIMISSVTMVNLRSMYRCFLSTIQALKLSIKSGVVVGGGAVELAVGAQLEMTAISCGNSLPDVITGESMDGNEDAVVALFAASRALFHFPRCLGTNLGTDVDPAIQHAIRASCRWACLRSSRDSALWPVAGLSLDLFDNFDNMFNNTNKSIDDGYKNCPFLVMDPLGVDQSPESSANFALSISQCSEFEPKLVLEPSLPKRLSLTAAVNTATSIVNVRAIMTVT